MENIINRPNVIILFGLTACGKSTTASFLQRELNWKIISTHEIKNELGYRNTLSENERTKAYKKLYIECENEILKKNNIILDAGFNSIKRRNKIYYIIEKYSCNCVAIKCFCNNFLTIIERVNYRKLDKSKPENQASNISTYFHIKKGFQDLSDDERHLSGYAEFDTFKNRLSHYDFKFPKYLLNLFSIYTGINYNNIAV